ncbi:MAG: lytic transglycosylase domain-containing protein [Deltaproteobacteria bacterium]|nr:lytic transglycosylase domain-containing protein [Deltaproteobacteria bacterium]
MRNRRHATMLLAVLASSCATVQRVEDRPPGPPPAVSVPVSPPSELLPAAIPPQQPEPAPAPADRPDTPEAAATTDRREPYCPEVAPRPVACADAVRIAKDVAVRHGLETGLVVGVMRVESGFVANAISRATAVGLMQVMPGSGRQAGCGDLFSPDENAECGGRILKAFLRHYKGNLVLALSGYNAGHGMPDRAKKETRIPRNFRYVEDVLRARSRYLRHGCREWD